MAWVPTSGIPVSIRKNAGGAAASGYYLKFYQDGTTTAISVATDATGGTTLAKVKLNTQGYPLSNPNSDSSIFIPYVNQAYKVVLYATEAAADANDTGSAVWIVDDINLFSTVTVDGISVDVGTYLSDQTVDDYVELRARDPANYAVGMVVTVTDDGIAGDFKVVTGSATDNGGTIITNATWNTASKHWERVYSGEVFLEWFEPAINGSTDDTTAMSNLFSLVGNGTAKMGTGTTVLNEVENSETNFYGMGEVSVLKAATGAANTMKLGYGTNRWRKKRISQLKVNGNSKGSDGFSIDDTSSSELAGPWEIDGVTFVDCLKAVGKSGGNIGNSVTNCDCSGSDFFYWIDDSASIHGGNETISRSHIQSTAKAVFYVNSTIVGTGQITIKDCILEFNPGFGVFCKNYRSAYTPLVIDNVWFEANASSGSVTIDAVSYTPRDIYLENCEGAIIKSCPIVDVEIINSLVKLESCSINSDTAMLIGSDSNVYAESVINNGARIPGLIVHSVLESSRELGNFATVMQTIPRTTTKINEGAELLIGKSFGDKNLIPFTGSASVSATILNDGVIFNTCSQLSIAAGYTLLDDDTFTVQDGYWCVWSIDIKHVSGPVPSTSLSGAGTVAGGLGDFLVTGEWVHLMGIGPNASGAGLTARLSLVNGGVSASVVNLSAFQVLEFADKKDAIDYINSGVFSHDDNRRRVTWSDAAPTNGTWRVGDRVYNVAPTVDGNNMVLDHWVCTSAGTPGTWTAQYISSVSPAT